MYSQRRVRRWLSHALQGSLHVEVGDWVKLSPATGETEDTVSQLQVPSSPRNAACQSRTAFSLLSGGCRRPQLPV